MTTATEDRTRPFAGRTVLMSGGSRGIGLAIGIRLAREGANVALLAKTDTPHPRLPGTVHTAADEIRAAGGQALAIVGDVRDEDQVVSAIQRTIDAFGGIDIVVNNASAIDLMPVERLATKRFDLMFDINVRGTFLLMHHAARALTASPNPHILTLSPPISLDRKWFQAHAPYTASKYSMTMLTLGLAESMRADGVAANCLWPATMIDTAAVRSGLAAGSRDAGVATRTPEIMADAARTILLEPATSCTGHTFVDEAVLRDAGVDDFSTYLTPGSTEATLEVDLFL